MRPLLILTALLCTAGCKSEPCMSLPDMNALLAQAALVRVDVYDSAQAQCANGFVTAQGAAILSRTFPGGAAVRLDIPPGDRVIAMTTYGDAEGKMPTGSACTESTLSGGRGACLSLTLTEIDGGACTPANDTCPPGQYCGTSFACLSGCKTNADCTGSTTMCEPNRHQCVQCLATTDCTPGMVCSSSGTCTQDCSVSGTCSGGKTCCSGVCVDTLSDPLNCNGCNQACTGGNTLCCNGQCDNPSTSLTDCGMCGNACSTLNGTPTCSAGVCNWTCNANFVHCGSGNTGCDTPSNTVNNCGGCGNVCTPTNASANTCMSAMQCSYTCQNGFLDCMKIGANTDGCESSANSVTSCGGCNNVCDTMHSMGASCPAGACTYTGCAPGYEDCKQTAPNTDGCESPVATHMNGLGETYMLSCVPLGTPGNPNTYTLAMATAARAAWTAGTDSTLTCTGNAACLTRTGASTCATWCYTKTVAGHVLEAATCTCPTTGSPSWN
jgi:hypothetical protein